MVRSVSLPVEVGLQKHMFVVGKTLFLNGRADFFHQVKVESDIVNACQDCRQDFVCGEQMMQVRPCEVLTGITVAVWLHRIKVTPVFFIGEPYLPAVGEESGAAGIACRDNAVKHVHTTFDALENIFWQANSHEITRFVVG